MHVHVVRQDRILDGARYRRDRRFVQHVIDALERARHGSRITYIANEELKTLVAVEIGEIFSSPGGKIVERADTVPALEQGVT